MKFKNQELEINLDGHFAKLIIAKLRFQVWNHFQISTDFATDSFSSDAVMNYKVRFLGTDDTANKVKKFIEDNFEIENIEN